MKILLAFACVLSINVASAELVVYEGTGTRDGSEIRFVALIDMLTPRTNAQDWRGSDYQDVIKDLDIWIDGVAIPLPIAVIDPYERLDNNIRLRNDYPSGPAGSDRILMTWNQPNGDGTIFYFGFFIEDTTGDRPTMLSGGLPTAIDTTLADDWGIGLGGLLWTATSFTISTASDLLARLLTASEGVGPGKSLANKVILAQTYYAVPDVVSTCLVLGEYVQQTAHKKVPAAQGAALAEDARLIASAIGCE